MTLIWGKAVPDCGSKVTPVKNLKSQIKKKRKKNLLNTSAIRSHLSHSSLRLLKQYLHTFYPSVFWLKGHSENVVSVILYFRLWTQTSQIISLFLFLSHFEWEHYRGRSHLPPSFPPRPLVDHPPPFWKLSKYAKGTSDRWTVISLTIWPQFVFLANEADYWGRLTTLKSMQWLMFCH